MTIISDTRSTLSNPSLSKLAALPDPTLILLADILPTGLSVALNALMHPKLAPILHGRAWPGEAAGLLSGSSEGIEQEGTEGTAPVRDEDRVLTVGVVGLGPVGLVSSSLLRYFTIYPYICF